MTVSPVSVVYWMHLKTNIYTIMHIMQTSAYLTEKAARKVQKYVKAFSGRSNGAERCKTIKALKDKIETVAMLLDINDSAKSLPESLKTALERYRKELGRQDKTNDSALDGWSRDGKNGDFCRQCLELIDALSETVPTKRFKKGNRIEFHLKKSKKVIELHSIEIRDHICCTINVFEIVRIKCVGYRNTMMAKKLISEILEPNPGYGNRNQMLAVETLVSLVSTKAFSRRIADKTNERNRIMLETIANLNATEAVESANKELMDAAANNLVLAKIAEKIRKEIQAGLGSTVCDE
jgi:hypothetical protein